MNSDPPILLLFFFNDTATTEIYTLSLHDALPILRAHPVDVINSHSSTDTWLAALACATLARAPAPRSRKRADRKSTRLNSSHQIISYAVFCLKKKKNSHIK